MATETVERLYRVTADATQAARELEKISRSASETEATLKRFGDNVGNALKFVAGLEIGRQLVGYVNSTIDALDNLNDVAQRTGQSVETLSQLDYIAKLSGTSFEAMQTASVKLATGLAGIASGAKGASASLQALGLTGSEDTLTALEKISDQFADMEDGPKKVALATQIFGKAVGSELIPLLNQGSEELRKMRETADKLGITLSSEAVQAAADFNDQMDVLRLRVRAATARFIDGFLPALSDVVSASNDVTGQSSQWTEWGRAVGKAIADVTNGSIFLAGELEKLTLRWQATREFMAKNSLSDVVKGVFTGKTVEDATAIWSKYEKQVEAINKRQQDAQVAMFRGAKLTAAAQKALDDLENPPKKAKGKGPKLGGDDDGGGGGKAKSQVDQLAKAMEGYAQALESVRLMQAKVNEGWDEERAKAYADVVERIKAAGGTDADVQQAWAMVDARLAQSDAMKRETEFQKAVIAGNVEEAKSIEAKKKAQEDYASALELAADPVLQFTSEIKKLNEVAGMISSDAYWKEFDRIKEATIGAKDVVVDFQKQFADGFKDFASDAAANLTGFIDGTTKSWGDMVEGMLKSLAKVITQTVILKGLQMALGGTSFGAAIFGKAANGAVFEGGGKLTPFAKGTVVSSPTVFPFANGVGLMAEAGPEAIMPLSRGADGSLGVKSQGGNVTVNVINQTDGTAEVKETSNANGDRFIDILITKKVAAGIATGAYDAAMQSAYGINRKGR